MPRTPTTRTYFLGVRLKPELVEALRASAAAHDRPMAIEVEAALRAWPPIAKLLQPKKETK